MVASATTRTTRRPFSSTTAPRMGNVSGFGSPTRKGNTVRYLASGAHALMASVYSATAK